MSKIQKRPNIMDYLDLAQYLSDVFQCRKISETNFSYSTWASEIGFQNKTLLRFILRKQRRISSKSALLIKENLCLGVSENAYFDALLSYSQAKTESERRSFGATLVSLQRAQYRPLEMDSAIACVSAFAPMVISLLAHDDIIGTPANLARMLGLKKEETAALLAWLVDSKILSVDDGHRYTFDSAGFRVPDKPGDRKLRAYHEYWIERAKQAIDLPASTRKFRALKVALTEEEFDRAIDRINDFALSLLSSFNTRSFEGRRLYMLEMLLFPVTDRQPTRSSGEKAISTESAS